MANKVKSDKSKMYVLGMFPYPSGDGLHVGHVRIYTAVDVMARYFRMKGYEVLEPTGWDAFGLPAENAAIKNKTNPQEIVPKNYNNFRAQMKNLNFDFDWSRELATTDPSYYGLTQWIFLELYKRGLVYREQVPINWCPKCLTGLANEEVLPDGTHERCGTPVTKKDLPQWVMKITEYAERLLQDLDVDLKIQDPRIDAERSALDWPRGILEMQRNWIGKDKGLDIDFTLSSGEAVTVWTKYWETVFGTTFLVVAPEIAQGWVKNGWKASKNVIEYVQKSVNRTDLSRQEGVKEKTGVDTGLTATNKVNGQSIPVYVADYVLASVGTGAVMGVPAHDERDFAFAKKYEMPIVQVVSYQDKEINEKVSQGEMSYEGAGVLVNSGKFNGMEAWGEGKKKIADWMIEGGFAKWRTNYHLRDWVFSRQRYWGEPIPLVYCDKCGDKHGVVPLPETDLPLELPYLESYEPTDTGESPLTRVADWVKTTCPNCGGPARRETDTMPNWAGSCWYHLAFPFWRAENAGEKLSTKSQLDTFRKSGSKTPFTDYWQELARPAIDKWLPVDWYLGGAEHAVLHLLYARFWMKVLFDLGHIGLIEPYLRLRSVGIVLAEDGRKMSKSWGNVINPDDVIKEFGSDAVRLYEMFMGPWDQAIAWDSRALVGMRRFVDRITEVYSLKAKFGKTTSPQLLAILGKLADRVEKGIIEQKFNTSIASQMEFLNAWRNSDLVLSQKHARNFAQIMSSFAPETAQQMWEVVGGKGAVAEQAWPTIDESEAAEVPVTIAVQVNGKLRGTIEISSKDGQSESAVMTEVLKEEKITKWVSGKPKKTIFVPGRLVNLIA